MGDFNLARFASDKNTTTFNAFEAGRFNDLINSLVLVEIPLVDRAYTWSNKRSVPTLVRLDRCFVNTDWEAIFPNTSLASLTRVASDHVPLLTTAATTIPRGRCFRFENAWLHNRAFRTYLGHELALPVPGLVGRGFVRRLKLCRRACRSWAKAVKPIDQRAHDTKILIRAIDLLEEARPLHPEEAELHRLAADGLQAIHAERVSYWRQHFNVKVALDWDKNSKFFHVGAFGRRRKNTIPCLEHNGVSISSHDAKSTLLFNFY